MCYVLCVLPSSKRGLEIGAVNKSPQYSTRPQLPTVNVKEPLPPPAPHEHPRWPLPPLLPRVPLCHWPIGRNGPMTNGDIGILIPTKKKQLASLQRQAPTVVKIPINCKKETRKTQMVPFLFGAT